MALDSLIGRGLVLKRARHLDDDSRLTVFFRDVGKIQVLCKGTQKMRAKLRSLTELFVEADFHLAISAHGLSGRLIGGRLLESRRFLCEKFNRFETASRILETVDVLLPARAPAPEVFDILRQALQALKAAPEPDWAWVQFVVKLLKCLGHGDMLESGSMDPSSPSNLLAWLSRVDEELERLLPRRLKSAV